MNIDLKCAEAANEISKIGLDESSITKSLGILQEDGIYAFFLYILSQKDEAVKLSKKTYDLLNFFETKLGDINSLYEDWEGATNDKKDKKKIYSDILLNKIRTNILNDLDKLFFCKEIIERTLIYARYNLKAVGAK